jgi:uncharacterized integral membrane protein
MPLRLIQIIVFFAVILLFIIFNLDKKCDISFGFTVIRDVPVFLTVFCSFVLVMLSTLPFILSHQLRKKRKTEDEKLKPVDSPGLPNSSHYGID